MQSLMGSPGRTLSARRRGPRQPASPAGSVALSLRLRRLMLATVVPVWIVSPTTVASLWWGGGASKSSGLSGRSTWNLDAGLTSVACAAAPVDLQEEQNILAP